ANPRPSSTRASPTSTLPTTPPPPRADRPIEAFGPDRGRSHGVAFGATRFPRGGFPGARSGVGYPRHGEAPELSELHPAECGRPPEASPIGGVAHRCSNAPSRRHSAASPWL